MATNMLAIGVDVGATKIAAALVSVRGQVLASRQAPARAGDGAEAVLDRIATEVNALLAEAPGAVAGVGIGTPGRVNPVEGVVRNAEIGRAHV